MTTTEPEEARHGWESDTEETGASDPCLDPELIHRFTGRLRTRHGEQRQDPG
jgi:hypothetical protein